MFEMIFKSKTILLSLSLGALIMLGSCGGEAEKEEQTPTAPTAATASISATVSLNVMTVSWSPVPGAATYNVYWATAPMNGDPLNASGSATVGATSYVLPPVTTGNTYFVLVEGANQVGTGPLSAEFSITGQTFYILAWDEGWWSLTTGYPGTKNTFTGWDGSDSLRSFFVFDLSTYSGQVAAAALSLNLDGFWGVPSKEVCFYDVTTDATTLTTPSGVNTAVYDDLGTGVNYTCVTASSGMALPFQWHIDLNDVARADADAALGTGNIAFGAKNQFETGTVTEGVRFGGGLNNNSNLVLDIWQ